MPTKKKPAERGALPPVTNIHNCNFTADSRINEFTRDAVVALANAAEANARAIEAAASALQTPALCAPMIHIGNES